MYLVKPNIFTTRPHKLKNDNTHTHTPIQMLLLPPVGHAHLVEPGCLRTKQALWTVQAKLLEPG